MEKFSRDGKKMKVTVVICTYNRPKDLEECLKSLDRGFITPDEVIIVDDGDMQKTKEIIKNASLTNIKEIKHVKGWKKGLPASRNIGIQYATGDIICFIDDDVIVPPNWLEEILKGYKDNKDAVGVGGCVLNYNPTALVKSNLNSLRYRLLTAFRLVFFYNKVGKISPIGVLYAPHIFITDTYKEVDTLIGTNMSFRREVFNQYKFDEYYGLGDYPSINEGVDFCTRLSRDGKKLIYNPNAIVLHKRTLSGGERGKGNYNREIYLMAAFRNMTYYIMKNFNNMKYLRLTPLLIRALIYSIINFKLCYLKAIRDGIRLFKHVKGEKK